MFQSEFTFKSAIGFTSLKIDLGCHFGFTWLGFLGVYFSNTLERPGLFLEREILVGCFAKPLVKLNPLSINLAQGGESLGLFTFPVTGS